MGLGPSCTRGEVRTWEINKRPSNLDTRPIPHSTTGQLPSPLPTSTHLMSVAIAFFPTRSQESLPCVHETRNRPLSTTVRSKTSYEFANFYLIHLEFSSLSPRTERYRSALLIQICYSSYTFSYAGTDETKILEEWKENLYPSIITTFSKKKNINNNLRIWLKETSRRKRIKLIKIYRKKKKLHLLNFIIVIFSRDSFRKKKNFLQTNNE